MLKLIVYLALVIVVINPFLYFFRVGYIPDVLSIIYFILLIPLTGVYIFARFFWEGP